MLGGVVWMDGRCWHLSRPLSILQMPYDKSILAFLSAIHEISHPLALSTTFLCAARSLELPKRSRIARMPYTYGLQGDWKGCLTGNGGKLSNN